MKFIIKVVISSYKKGIPNILWYALLFLQILFNTAFSLLLQILSGSGHRSLRTCEGRSPGISGW